MSSAERHTFKSTKPVKRHTEEMRFYIKLRGMDRHKAKSISIPRTLVSDCRQVAEYWSAALTDVLPKLRSSVDTHWKSSVQQWKEALDRLMASKLSPNELYDDNLGFWLGVRRLVILLGSLDHVVTRSDVLVWAIKKTFSDHAETVQSHAEAVVDAGRSAAKAVRGVASSVPTVAKALAVAAVGLGVYTIAKRD